MAASRSRPSFGAWWRDPLSFVVICRGEALPRPLSNVTLLHQGDAMRRPYRKCVGARACRGEALPRPLPARDAVASGRRNASPLQERDAGPTARDNRIYETRLDCAWKQLISCATFDKPALLSDDPNQRRLEE